MSTRRGAITSGFGRHKHARHLAGNRSICSKRTIVINTFGVAKLLLKTINPLFEKTGDTDARCFREEPQHCQNGQDMRKVANHPAGVHSLHT
ncbi:hypothetical protein RvY_09766 [Ramazzottius varieornatus]|uniref:Uncharacterized protein n=1 Tax=Ramazzottius varieornatus TaxID=947166 RepID=A0A1D1VFW5_RAMVA|nr:hypothetical protein RvY_09766 [Ramazzottius varieornatus]